MFALAGIVLFRLCADRLSLNADEGIYLDGALRVMNGQATYRDFFVHTGPGTCWIYAAVFRMLGPSLTHARLPVICEIAAITACRVFLTANLTSYGFGLAVSFIAFAFLTRDIGMIGIVALSIALWMAADREIRKLLPAFLLGMTAVSILHRHSCGRAGARSGHSSSSVDGSQLFEGQSCSLRLEIGSGLGAVGWIFYALLLSIVAIPAVLPVLTWLGWALYLASRRPPLRRKKPILFLIVRSVALVASTSFAIFAWAPSLSQAGISPMETPAGVIRVAPEESRVAD